jgi:3-phenylpropionate/trans-cinnamate dioxygenase ferredoxin reductase subunit
MTLRRVIIVGGGVGGASAAAELREAGFDGELVLISDEDELPYERPPLSKEFLLEHGTPEHPAVKPEHWYEQQEVELMRGTKVTAIDLPAREVVLAAGRRLGYEALILATGVRARRLPIADGDRVLYMRTADDARRLRAALADIEHVVVVGGGWLGCEVAAAARVLRRRATLITADGLPLQRTVGSLIAGAMTDIHHHKGVELRTDEQLTGVVQHGDHVEVKTSRELLEGDLMVIACGSTPNTELAEAAGLPVNDGILVDEFCRTAAEGVYAVGDVARQRHPRYPQPLRVEHHDNAHRHARCAARDILGTGEPFDEAHWFWSDQYGHSLQAVGQIDDPEDVILRGAVEDRSFSVVGLRDGQLRFVVSLDRPRDVIEARRILFTEHQLMPEQVADSSVPLKRMVTPDRHRVAAAEG